jgi:hypothetical protein
MSKRNLKKPKSKPNLYERNYNYHLPWEKAIWVVQEGEEVQIDNELYEIVKVTRLPMPGKRPNIKVRRKDAPATEGIDL